MQILNRSHRDSKILYNKKIIQVQGIQLQIYLISEKNKYLEMSKLRIHTLPSDDTATDKNIANYYLCLTSPN